jgi:hypothetical protein
METGLNKRIVQGIDWNSSALKYEMRTKMEYLNRGSVSSFGVFELRTQVAFEISCPLEILTD